MTLGERIYKLRTEKEMSQGDLVALLCGSHCGNCSAIQESTCRFAAQNCHLYCSFLAGIYTYLGLPGTTHVRPGS